MNMENINRTKKRANKYRKGILNVYDFALVCIDEHYLRKSMPSKKNAYDIFIDLAEDGFGIDVDLPCYKTFCNWINEMPIMEKIAKNDGIERELSTKAIHINLQNRRSKFSSFPCRHKINVRKKVVNNYIMQRD